MPRPQSRSLSSARMRAGSEVKLAAVRMAPDDEGGEHAGLDAFAGHVADDDEHAAVAWIGKDLKEVAADLAGGPVFAGDGEAGRGRQLRGNEVLLHIARGVDFAGEEGALFGDLALVAEEEGEQGGEHAGGGDGAGRQQRKAPAGKEIGYAGDGNAGIFRNEPDEVCRPQ